MLLCTLNFLSLVFLIYDTLGYVAVYMNKESDDSKKDYNRLILTWFFYYSVRWLSCSCGCSTGEGYIAGLLYLILTLTKLAIALPITGVSKILAKTFIEDRFLCKLITKALNSMGVQCNAQCGESSCAQEGEKKVE